MASDLKQAQKKKERVMVSSISLIRSYFTLLCLVPPLGAWGAIETHLQTGNIKPQVRYAKASVSERRESLCSRMLASSDIILVEKQYHFHT
jgi:hypothetical protein